MTQDAQLREHEIRPADTAAEQKRRYESDVARMLARRSEFVEVSCPACSGGERSLRFNKHDLDYQECLCGTVYVSPRPTPDVLRDYYENSLNYEYWNKVIFPASESTRKERIFRPRVEQLLAQCAKHAIRCGTLVEVGPGFGTFCQLLNEQRVFERVIAVEPTPELAKTCRERGIEVLEARIEEADLSENVDVVVGFEVIEHLFEPSEFVATCARVLRPGGLLVLTCPNIRGFDIDVLGPGSPAVDAEHLNYFHPASLSHLVSLHGFEVLETRTPGKLDADIVRNRVLAGEAALADRFLKRILLDEWETLGGRFQDFLRDNGLSSNMWIVARRR
jgi:2-polyprenyl-3-methyl-5-hydroxy-6-metoxy-1,4-benzoquinol methylase